MKKLIDKYVRKITEQGLADAGNITLLGLDAELSSNQPISDISPELIRVFDCMNINSLLHVVPAEPYKSIIEYLAGQGSGFLVPSDCETRTFLHDIPVIPGLSADAISSVLSKRKAAIAMGSGIISYGTVSPEQAFVSFSSVCFSAFVKFFVDLMHHLEDCSKGKAVRNESLSDVYKKVSPLIHQAFPACDSIPAEPPQNRDEALQQIVSTGKELVKRGLVDSYFGNISYTFSDTVYISQTGSSMDELETCIDAVPVDGSSSSGITASSELSAHIGIMKKTGRLAIVHGHPKFTVIMSMSCRKEGCNLSDCYRTCREERAVCGIPVVSGEIGTGPTGLVITVPEAMAYSPAVIVFGHGIFSAAMDSFRSAFELMQATEQACMMEYFKKIQELT